MTVNDKMPLTELCVQTLTDVYPHASPTAVRDLSEVLAKWLEGAVSSDGYMTESMATDFATLISKRLGKPRSSGGESENVSAFTARQGSVSHIRGAPPVHLTEPWA